MAKRRKEKDEEEDKPFKLPKFDEEGFLKRERRNIKSTFISFLFGIAMALICFAFWALMGQSNFRWPLVVLVALANSIFLKTIFERFNIDISDFGRKNWFGSFAIYIFTWLVILIVLVNPPFYDDEPPTIEAVVLPNWQEFGGTINILAKITDNSGIEKGQITFTIDDNSISSENFEYIDNIFRYSYESPENNTGEETHTFKLTIKDAGGHTAEIEDTFGFSNETIYLALPKSGDTIFAASDVKFGIKTDVWKVYYAVNDGQEINATQQPDRTDFYVTSPEYQGWVAGDNVTVNVSAIVVHNFENHFYRDENGNLIVDKNGNAIPHWFFNYINDTSTYKFDVAAESSIGQNDEIPVSSTLIPRVVAAPGFETIIFLFSLVIVALIFKKRKKDRRKQK